MTIILICTLFLILFVAWIITRKRDTSPVKESKVGESRTIPEKITKVFTPRTFSGKRFERKHEPIHPEKTKARKEAYFMRKYNFSLQGLYLHTDNKLYWMTHKLAVEHQND